MQIQVANPGAMRTRHTRRPNFPIAGTMKPFGLYPIMYHPVLPGETLKSASLRWNIVSQPVKNPLSGAWLETWIFYVKLTDMDPDLGNMFISDSYSTSGWTSGGNVQPYFAATGQINWGTHLTESVHLHYFRNEGESQRTFTDNGASIRMVKSNNVSWYQNLMFEPAETALDTSGPRDAHEQLTAWQMVQQMQMTELTYERYLKEYGVRNVESMVAGTPELLRYARSWTLPANTIDPTDGTPSSAWIWRDEMKAEKDKRFNEPGFLITLASIRPKMFNSMVPNSLSNNLWGFSDFYPAYNLDDPTAGIKNIGTTDSVFDASWNGAESDAPLLYDHRDLLNHGEQFVNDWTNNPYPHPTNSNMSGLAAADPQDVRGEYPSLSDIDALFVASGATEAEKRAQYEGLMSLTIAGHVKDTTR
jgi:hypothetical protein